jgi:hypothetical protein
LGGETREFVENLSLDRLDDRPTGAFYKVVSFPYKPFEFRVFPFSLSDHDPSALGTRFNTVNINSDISDGKRDTFEVTSQTNCVGENRKVHLLAAAI